MSSPALYFAGDHFLSFFIYFFILFLILNKKNLNIFLGGWVNVLQAAFSSLETFDVVKY